MIQQSQFTNLIPQGGLTIDQAAKYVGLSVSGFRAWLRKGQVSCKIEGTQRYDLKALDAALDNLSGLVKTKPEPTLSPYDAWKASQPGSVA